MSDSMIATYAGHSEGDGSRIKVFKDFDDRQYVVDQSSQPLFVVELGSQKTNPVPWAYVKRIAELNGVESFAVVNEDGSITMERSVMRNPRRKSRK